LVAFVAVTVKVEELPAVIEAGLELMLTVGAAFEPVKFLPPHPASSRGRKREEIVQSKIRRRESLLVVVKAGSFLSLDGSMASRKPHRGGTLSGSVISPASNRFR